MVVLCGGDYSPEPVFIKCKGEENHASCLGEVSLLPSTYTNAMHGERIQMNHLCPTSLHPPTVTNEDVARAARGTSGWLACSLSTCVLWFRDFIFTSCISFNELMALQMRDSVLPVATQQAQE